nr:GNAT family protein [Streptomyces misionensis]
MQRLLVDYLFGHSPVVRLGANTETGNVAEQRSLEKAGFMREGVMPPWVPATCSGGTR